MRSRHIPMCAVLGAILLIHGCSRGSPPPTPAPAPALPSVNLLWESRGSENLPLQRVIAIKRATDGKIWVAEGGADREVYTGRFFIFDPAGAFVETWGRTGEGPGEFIFSRGTTSDGADILFLPDGSFLVADSLNARIQRFDKNRHLVRAWGSGDALPSAPTGLALAANGEVLALFNNRPEIQRFQPDGSFLGMISAGLKRPMGICVDPFGRIWVSDRNFASDKLVDGIVRVFDPEGKPLFECGDREGDFTGLRNPGDLAADASGRVYLADNYHHRYVLFSPEGKVLTTIGQRGTGGLGFNYTNGVAIAENGDLYLGDWTGGRLLRVSLSGLP